MPLAPRERRYYKASICASPDHANLWEALVFFRPCRGWEIVSLLCFPRLAPGAKVFRPLCGLNPVATRAMARRNGFVGEPSGLPRRLGQAMRKREGGSLIYESQEPQAARACATGLFAKGRGCTHRKRRDVRATRRAAFCLLPTAYSILTSDITKSRRPQGPALQGGALVVGQALQGLAVGLGGAGGRFGLIGFKAGLGGADKGLLVA